MPLERGARFVSSSAAARVDDFRTAVNVGEGSYDHARRGFFKGLSVACDRRERFLEPRERVRSGSGAVVKSTIVFMVEMKLSCSPSKSGFITA